MINADYNDWTLVSLSPLQPVWQIIGVTLLVVACGLVLWSYRGARRRWTLSTMRLLAALIVIGFLIEPALQLRVVRKIRNRLGIVVDRSRSMTLGTEDGRSRYDHVLAQLEQDRARLTELGESHLVEIFDLSGPIASAALNALPDGERTDLLGALERARDGGAGRPLAGLVLLSDGADNVDLEGPEPGSLSSQALERLKRIGVPINAVNVADADAFKDIAIVDVISDEFAFVHNSFEVDVRIESTGMGSPTVPVTLRREGDVLATQEVALKSGHPTLVKFRIKPDKIGSFVYSVSIPVFAGEAITSNNQRSFVVQVIRDKIRVLQVSGRPSWDERFLRQHLKENPNVDLISFFILRTQTDAPGAPESELSLIPFPTKKLFTTELRSFDVVVFQNFDYRPYSMAQFLPNIRDAVTEGMGFVMIGGEQSFGGGGYVGTALDEIIPLRMDTGLVVEARVSPKLTDAGRRHPVTDMTRGTGNNERAWRDLPGWTSINATAGLRQGATALVRDERVRAADGSQAPLVAVMDVGRGRALAIATDSMWRWRFALHRDGGASERAYHRFWSNALHWLVRDPEHSRIRVLPEKRRFETGHAVGVTFVVRGSDYQPVPFASLRVSLEQGGIGGVRVDDLSTGEAGVARHRYEGLPTGAYRMLVEARAGGRDLGSGSGVFVVEARSLELSRGAPRPDLMQAIAQQTGGAYLELGSGMWKDLEVVDPDIVEVDRRRNIELWDNAWALAAGVLILGLEWALRRRSGYL
ncbi:MAG: glutamine amidotransferase [Myxococcota bacterium]